MKGNNNDLGKRYRELQYLQEQNDVIRLDSSKFNRFVKTNPKNYSLVVMFTAMKPMRQCKICAGAYEEYKIAAHSYRKSDVFNTKIFFTLVDFDEADDIFQLMNMNTAPSIYLINKSIRVKKDQKFDIRRLSGQALLLWLKDVADIKIPLVQPINYFFIILMGTAAVVVASAIYVKRESFSAACDRRVCAMMAVMFILIFISGQMWNQIRGARLFEGRPNGETSFIAGSSSNQYIVETYIVMGIYGMCVLGMIMCTKFDLSQSEELNKISATCGFAIHPFLYRKMSMRKRITSTIISNDRISCLIGEIEKGNFRLNRWLTKSVDYHSLMCRERLNIIPPSKIVGGVSLSKSLVPVEEYLYKQMKFLSRNFIRENHDVHLVNETNYHQKFYEMKHNELYSYAIQRSSKKMTNYLSSNINHIQINKYISMICWLQRLRMSYSHQTTKFHSIQLRNVLKEFGFVVDGEIISPIQTFLSILENEEWKDDLEKNNLTFNFTPSFLSFYEDGNRSYPLHSLAHIRNQSLKFNALSPSMAHRHLMLPFFQLIHYLILPQIETKENFSFDPFVSSDTFGGNK
ncbi:hypothetical protein SNEBB_008334 [Seison nebaliae]|nr:hypothetical protein SNEBB_008334 [Seison nebaliae]